MAKSRVPWVFTVLSLINLLLPIGMLVLGDGLLYSRAVPQLGYMVTVLPMPLMVLSRVAELGWVSLVLARGR